MGHLWKIKYSLLIFIVTVRISVVRGGRLCDFAEKFPEEHNRKCGQVKRRSHISQTMETDANITKTEKSNTSCDCQSTCEQSICLQPSIGNASCVCEEGLLLKGTQCVRKEDCPCFVRDDGILIPENGTFVNPNCTVKCSCINATLTCKESYSCNQHAVCGVKNYKRKCYCKDGYHGDGITCSPSTDCMSLYKASQHSSGVYTIKPTNWSDEPFGVYCNSSHGGGWTVIQRRLDGTVNFDRAWSDYKQGFGKPDHEFWLGNEKLHYLTAHGQYELRIDFVNSEGNSYYALYSEFRIGNESKDYRLTDIGMYNGTAGPKSDVIMRRRLDAAFGTYDKSDNKCTGVTRAGWWHGMGCGNSILNEYPASWLELPTASNNITFVEMKIRPTQ